MQTKDNTNETYKQDWDLVIEPQSSLLEINFKDVWNYRDLLWLLVKRDFVSCKTNIVFEKKSTQ